MAEGVEVGRAYVTVLPNATGFATSLQSSVVPGAGVAGAAAGKKLGGGLLGGVKGIVGPMAAILSVAAIVDFFKDSIAGAEESSKVMRTTEQVIKSTGGSAKVTAAHVNTLAGALSGKSGVDDEVIQKGANMLLTFKNVRNEVGKGNAIFDRATAAAVDLSATGFGSVEGSSKMLGKALNDPVKGISALGRAGVTFSQEQKDQIKTWVEHGDTLKAQNAIMAEVESQVGGVAAASANMSDKMGVAWGNFQEQVGAKLLPLLDTLGNFFIGTLLPILSQAVDWLAGLGTETSAAGTQFSGLVGQAQPLVDWFNGSLMPALAALWATFQEAFDTMVPLVTEVVNGMLAKMEPMMPTVQNIFSTIGSIITTVLDLIGAVVKLFVSTVTYIWDQWGDEIMNVAQAAWTGALKIIDPLVRGIQQVIALVMNIVKGDWKAVWENIKGILQATWDTIKAVVQGAIDVVKSVLALAWAVIATGAEKQWNDVKNTISGVMNAVKGFVTSAWNTITGATSSAWNTVVSTIGGAVSDFKAKIDSALDTVVGWFKSFPGKVISAIGNVASKLTSVGGDMVEGIWKGISSGYGWIKGKITGWVGDVVSFFKRVFGIGSPSKVMADEVGQWVGKGAIMGVDDTLGDAQKASERMAAALTPDMGAVSYGSGLAGLAGAAGASITYGDIKLDLSIAELEEFTTLIDFLKNIDRRVQAGVTDAQRI